MVQISPVADVEEFAVPGRRPLRECVDPLLREVCRDAVIQFKEVLHIWYINAFTRYSNVTSGSKSSFSWLHSIHADSELSSVYSLQLNFRSTVIPGFRPHNQHEPFINSNFK
eukprot:GHVU01231111.1.p4 GENE.GHVU01231111.1~~GHVU01231111.1.p4  ORF type:complete len:112 (-),score=6.43 GHVU01231111.1:1162-1497(-)